MRRLRVDVYPLALVATAVVTLFVNAGEPLVVLPRPLVIAAVATLLLQGALSLATRSAAIGALGTLVVLLVLAGLWPLAVAALILPTWWALAWVLRRRSGHAPPPTAVLTGARRALDVFSLILLGLAVVNAALSGAFTWYGPPSSVGTPPAGAPDIYLIQLDGYPGIESLRTQLGVDNSAFGEALASRGFDVISGSRSNYSQTWMTLASMFDMRYVDQEPGVANVPADLGAQRRWLARIINAGEALALLRERGYHVVTYPSAFTSAALLSADVVHDPGSLNEFEELLLRKSGLAGLLGDLGQSWVAGQARDRLRYTLAAVGNPGPMPAGPVFVFDHVLAPHPPFLFDAKGGPAPLRVCYPAQCPFWVADLEASATSRANYAEQLQEELAYLDSQLLEGIDTLVARDPTAVIILFSDHGMRFDASDVREHFESFFAARTPGHANAFDAQISPVNVFPELLNAYFDAELPTTGYKAWQSGALPLDVAPVDPR